MDILNSLLLWNHLGALALGGAATFGLPAVGAQMPGAAPEARAALVKASMLLGKLGGTAIGLLILSGLLLIGTRFGGTGGFNPWFWVKMALVVGFIVLISLSRRNAAKAVVGDREAAARQKYFALGGVVLLLSIVLCAVLAFG